MGERRQRPLFSWMAAAAVTLPSLGNSSAVAIQPSRLKLPREVSSRSIVKAGAFIPAHSPSGGAELGNEFFTVNAASKTSPKNSLMSRLDANTTHSRTFCCLGRSVFMYALSVLDIFCHSSINKSCRACETPLLDSACPCRITATSTSTKV